MESVTGTVEGPKPSVEGALAFFASRPEQGYNYNDNSNCAVAQYIKFMFGDNMYVLAGPTDVDWGWRPARVLPYNPARVLPYHWNFIGDRAFVSAVQSVNSKNTFGGIVKAYEEFTEKSHGY
jgi:hypothetical protein